MSNIVEPKRRTSSYTSQGRYCKIAKPINNQENKFTIFPLTDEKEENDFDKLVDEKREEKLAEEQKVARLKKQELEKEKQKRELEERNNEIKKRQKEGYHQSYDVFGKIVEIRCLSAFPILARKCEGKTTNFNEVFKQPQFHKINKRIIKKQKGKQVNVIDVKFSSTEENGSIEFNKKIFPSTTRVYEDIVLKAGVSISERGKNTRTSGSSIGRERGRLSKVDYNNSLGMLGGTVRASTSVPSISHDNQGTLSIVYIQNRKVNHRSC